jgi:hypothetical protein
VISICCISGSLALQCSFLPSICLNTGPGFGDMEESDMIPYVEGMNSSIRKKASMHTQNSRCLQNVALPPLIGSWWIHYSPKGNVGFPGSVLSHFLKTDRVWLASSLMRSLTLNFQLTHVSNFSCTQWCLTSGLWSWTVLVWIPAAWLILFFFLILQGMVNEGNFYHMADSEKHFEKNLPTSSLIYLPSTNIYRMCTLCQGSSMPS